MTVEDRMRPVMRFQPEVASLNMGSMNFGLFPMLERYKNLQHDWERQHLENSRDRSKRRPAQRAEWSVSAMKLFVAGRYSQCPKPTTLCPEKWQKYPKSIRDVKWSPWTQASEMSAWS